MTSCSAEAMQGQKLPVQHPKTGPFSFHDITWHDFDTPTNTIGKVKCAYIPYDRVGDFIKGEEANSDCPTYFHKRSQLKNEPGSLSRPKADSWISNTVYWCSYGPTDNRGAISAMVISEDRPKAGPGSRPKRLNSSIKRGCQCHFAVKRLYLHPNVALISYQQVLHVDKNTQPCHGRLDASVLGMRPMLAPRISDTLRQWVLSMLYVGLPPSEILDAHIKVVRERQARDAGSLNRDDLLRSKDVFNLARKVQKGTFQLHVNDEESVRLWREQNEDMIFFYQDCEGCLSPFTLGIQSIWQREMLIQYGHNGIIACDSTFGAKDIKYPLYSLLVFDEFQNALPVAWVITSSSKEKDIENWMEALRARALEHSPDWSPKAFMIDNPAFDSSVIRRVFAVEMYVCLWYARASWLRHLLTMVNSWGARADMLKKLGEIMCMHKVVESSGKQASILIESFMQLYQHENAFLVYFMQEWLPNNEQWIETARKLRHASQGVNASVEAYHDTMEQRFLEIGHIQEHRVDWLVHKLTTEIQSCYRYLQFQKQHGLICSLQLDGIIENSYRRALQILDNQVEFLDLDGSIARVSSCSRQHVIYTVYNVGSECSFCDCLWSQKGNICKHVLKIYMMLYGSTWHIFDTVSQPLTKADNNLPMFLSENVEGELAIASDTVQSNMNAKLLYEKLDLELEMFRLEYSNDVALMESMLTMLRQVRHEFQQLKSKRGFSMVPSKAIRQRRTDEISSRLKPKSGINKFSGRRQKEVMINGSHPGIMQWTRSRAQKKKTMQQEIDVGLGQCQGSFGCSLVDYTDSYCGT